MASDKLQKLTEEVEGMTVLELGEWVKMLQEKFGVSAVMPVAAAAAAGKLGRRGADQAIVAALGDALGRAAGAHQAVAPAAEGRGPGGNGGLVAVPCRQPCQQQRAEK